MKPKKTGSKIKNSRFNRFETIRFDAGTIDDKARTVPAAISSETKVQRYFGTEKLLHGDKNVNMERAIEGLPLLFNHNRDSLVGRAEDIRIEAGVMRANLVFSENPLADQVFKDVSKNFIRDVSVSGIINNYKDVKGGIEVTRWTPHEVSIVTVPADSSVGIHRELGKREVTFMSDDTKGKKSKTVVQRVDAKLELGISAGIKHEMERANSIREIFARHAGNEHATALMDQCLADAEITPEYATRALLDLQANKNYIPTSTATQSNQAANISAGQDESDKLSRAMEDAILVKGGIETDEKTIAQVNSSDIRSMSLLEMVKRTLGNQVHGLSEMDVAGKAFIRNVGGHSTSDFPSIMENVANKAMAKGYTEAPSTWRIFCDIDSVSDFKKTNMITLSEFSDLELKPEGGEYQYGTLKDKKEQIGVQTLAKGFSITREALINDDIGILTSAPKAMGVAANRSIEAMVYTIFLSNPQLLEDGKAVFHAGHDNIGTAGPPSEATLDEMRVLMGTQKGLLNSAAKGKKSTALIGARPKYIICPLAMELAMKRLMMAEYISADLQPNMVRNMAEVVSSPYLDVDSATRYYMLADKAGTDTIKVAFLKGNQTPYLARRQGWNVDGLDYHVRVDVGAAWMDFRGAVKNDGA